MSKFCQYQLDWIHNKNRFAIYEKSRRIGITFAEAYWSFRRRLLVKSDHIFCSADYKTSQEFLGYVAKFAMATNVAIGQQFINEQAFTSERITMPNGSRIIIVSSNPNALRGMGQGMTDLTWDEAAFHEHAEEWYRSALPISDWGGHFHIISTHNGSGTVFNQILKDARNKRNQFKVFRTTLEDAVAQGLCEKQPGAHRAIKDQEERRKFYLDQKRDSCLNAEMFNQEYMCEVLSASSIVTEPLYDACIIPNFPVGKENYGIDLNKSAPVVVGIDVGRTRDQTVIWAIEEGVDAKQINPKLKRTYRTVLVRRLKNVPFQSQYEIISSLISHKAVKRVLIENNGIGMQLSEQLVAAFPSKVSAWSTNSSNKAYAIERFAGWIAQNRIALPAEKEIKEDIMAMQRVISPTGKIAYEGRTATSHCDAFMAATLALEAAEGEPIVPFTFAVAS